MKRICAWCRKELSCGDAQDEPDGPISHGICESCKDNMLFQMGVELRRFLDSLDAPILIVDRERTVVAGNNRARELISKDLPEIEGLKTGQVFECEFARLPEGCGKTVHCSGCTIRRTVAQTHENGGSCLRVPAVLNWERGENNEPIDLLISTEKFRDLILLRIDGLGAKGKVVGQPSLPARPNQQEISKSEP